MHLFKKLPCHICLPAIANNTNTKINIKVISPKCTIEAIKAVANFDRKESIELLEERLKDTLSLNRELIVECLGNYKKKELVDFIKTFLADDDRQVRFQTVYSLFNIGGKEAALAMRRKYESLN